METEYNPVAVIEELLNNQAYVNMSAAYDQFVEQLLHVI